MFSAVFKGVPRLSPESGRVTELMTTGDWQRLRVLTKCVIETPGFTMIFGCRCDLLKTSLYCAALIKNIHDRIGQYIGFYSSLLYYGIWTHLYIFIPRGNHKKYMGGHL